MPLDVTHFQDGPDNPTFLEDLGTWLELRGHPPAPWAPSPDMDAGGIDCYARPSHAHVGHSPGLDFETRLPFKPDLPALLEQALRRPGYVARPVTLGGNTDPYQPVERTLTITRQALDVLERFGHPVSIVTRSAEVLRDLDILQRMARRNLAHVCLSVATLDANLARRMEPRAASPLRRLQAMRVLAGAGVPVGVLAAPLIPGLNDAELERILSESCRAGASRAGYVLLRMPPEIRQPFEAWAQAHFPDRAARILALVRETRGGAAYDSRFGLPQTRTGTATCADMLARRFAAAAARLDLGGAKACSQPLDCSQFAPPAGARTEQRQLELL